jgi:negative regulator of genetic competence, sporulation and motility
MNRDMRNCAKGDAAVRGIHIMELILISESKLKVMLTADDMRRYNLDCDTMDSDAAPSRRAFWNILDEARAQTGFDPGGEKVFVQLYPSKTGGCEMFVTKIGGNPADVSQTAIPRKHKKKSVPLCTEHAYAFTSLSHLLQACRRLKQTYTGSSKAYVDREKREYFLILSEEATVLAEYEAHKCKSREIPYILEYCRCFCNDAAGTLADLA